MSRRQADALIGAGRVQVNGVVASLGSKVCRNDVILVDGKPVETGAKTPIIIAYNKPVGVECTTDTDVAGNIITAVGYKERIFHIGRLDKDSEGLILLTNVGGIVNNILRSEFNHEKEYFVTLSAPISNEQIRLLSQGVELDDGPTKPCKIVRLNAQKIKVVLTEGRNRQIRRMIAFLGLEVKKLRRVRIINVQLGNLAVGEWRELRPIEVRQLLASIKATEDFGLLPATLH